VIADRDRLVTGEEKWFFSSSFSFKVCFRIKLHDLFSFHATIRTWRKLYQPEKKINLQAKQKAD
jgi:hypothetical protein